MEKNDALKPYYLNGPNSAYINAVSAISLLYRYCMSLQTDRYTVYAPDWDYENVGGLIQVSVSLPTVCPIVQPIKVRCSIEYLTHSIRKF